MIYKKTLKKRIAIILSLVLMLTPSFYAYADETFESDLAGENVHGPEMEDEEGEEGDMIEDDMIEGEECYSESMLMSLQSIDSEGFIVDPGKYNYGPYNSYAEIFMEAARVTMLNPFVMVAMIKQEQGDGTSPLVTGKGINNKYQGIYNILNWQAFAGNGMSARERGLWWANGADNNTTENGRPWTTPERSILRGFSTYAYNYSEKGQETYYFKKFNVNPYSITKGHTLYSHQYMTNLNGANGEGTILGNFYRSQGYDDDELVFLIPVYNNMPDDPVKKPDGDTPSVATYNPSSTDGYVQTIRDTFAGYSAYINLLLKLHDKYPKWKFTKIDTGLKWDDAVNSETTPSLSLVPGEWSDVWKSDNTSHDSGNWVGASKAAVAYYMDPRNFLIDDACVFQFLDQEYDTSPTTKQTLANVEKMCSGSFLGNTIARYSGSSSDNSNTNNTNTNKTKKKSSSGGGGGGGGGGSSKKTTTQSPTQLSDGRTFSPNWYTDLNGVWKIKNNSNQLVTTAWICDDAITANGVNVWYLLNTDGSMMSAGLVQDNTGNFYSLETDHNGYFGMLRYKNGYYNCNGQQVYLEFEQSHNGSFAAVRNAAGLAKLQEIYGVTHFGVDNSNNVYTSRF